MSIRCMTRVWAESQHKGSQLLLLLAIADFAHDDGFAFPSIQTLASKTRMSTRQTIRLIQEVEESGELLVGRRKPRSNVYVVCVGLTDAERTSALQKVHTFGAEIEPPSTAANTGTVESSAAEAGDKMARQGDKLSPSPKTQGDKMSPHSDRGDTFNVTSVSPDPSLSATKPSGEEGILLSPSGGLDLEAIWNQTREALKLQMTRETYDSWFPYTHIVEITAGNGQQPPAHGARASPGCTVVIGTPNELAIGWLKHRLHKVVKRALVAVLDEPVEVDFVLADG